jgi:hypothetical protein
VARSGAGVITTVEMTTATPEGFITAINTTLMTTIMGIADTMGIVVVSAATTN